MKGQVSRRDFKNGIGRKVERVTQGETGDMACGFKNPSRHA